MLLCVSCLSRFLQNDCNWFQLCDQEIVPLRKVCRRPETEYRLSGKPLSDISSSPIVDSKPGLATTVSLMEKPMAVEPSTV